MKDSFNDIYFDLIIESNKKIIEEGKFGNTILAGLTGLGITGGAVLGLNKASEPIEKHDQYKSSSTYTKSFKHQDKYIKNDEDTLDDDTITQSSETPIENGDKKRSNEDENNELTKEEIFLARVIYSETSYKATYEEILMLCQIIVNRIGHRDFGRGSNPFEVVNVKNAFSCINDPNNINWMQFKPDLNSRTKLCCKLAKQLMDGKQDFFDDDKIIYYHDKSKMNAWKKWVNKFYKPVRMYDTKNFQFYKVVPNNKSKRK